MGKREYNVMGWGKGRTLNVITSAKSIIWRISMLIPWLSIVYFISSIIHFLAASMPSVCCTSRTWLLVVLRPSMPSVPITSLRPVLKRCITYIKIKWKSSLWHTAKQKSDYNWVLSIPIVMLCKMAKASCFLACYHGSGEIILCLHFLLDISDSTRIPTIFNPK